MTPENPFSKKLAEMNGGSAIFFLRNEKFNRSFGKQGKYNIPFFRKMISFLAKYDLTEVVTEFGKFDHGPKRFGNQATQTTLQLDEVLIVWKIQIECEKRFQIFFIFTPSCGRFPFWLIFLRWVETTN